MTIKSEAEKIAAAAIVADPELREEDGWIFRERPGLPVECVERIQVPRNLASPYQARHNYPTA